MPRSQSPKSDSYSFRITLNLTRDTAAVLAYLESAMGQPKSVIARDALVRGLVDVGRLAQSVLRPRPPLTLDDLHGGTA